MKPICIQKYIKVHMRHSIRYKPEHLYDMYLDKVDIYERYQKVRVDLIKPATLRRNMLHWDWIERRGEGDQAYYVRIDAPDLKGFSDFYSGVIREYKALRERGFKW